MWYNRFRRQDGINPTENITINLRSQTDSKTATNYSTERHVCVSPQVSNETPAYNKKDSRVDKLIREMAKLWWSDNEDQENNNGDNGEQSSTDGDETTRGDIVSSNSSDDSFVVDQAKNMASLAIQSSMEKLWAKELYEMDPREREDITSEIHGVRSSRAIQETPELIHEGIQSLKDYIDRTLEDDLDNGDSVVPPITKDAYRQGISFASNEEGGPDQACYIRSNSFLLKFLRASHFDVEKTALRYFRCLDLMYGLFGDIALKRLLMLKDLTKRELQYLKKGQMQLLPNRDRAGRRIFAFSGREDRNFDVHEKYRVSMYLHDVCSEDETTQKLGLVSLNSPRVDPGTKPFGTTGMALQMKRHKSLGGLTEREFYHKFSEGCPLRLSAIHYTGPDTFIYRIGSALILSLLGREERKMVRFHGGSQIEYMYSLKSFGISPDNIPITDSGQIKTKNIGKFLTARLSIEEKRAKWYRDQNQRQHQQTQMRNGNRGHESIIEFEASPPSPGVECPEVNCIILGNRSQYNHSNLEFRQMLKLMELEREEKIVRCDDDVTSTKQLVHSIIAIARSPDYGFRFLKMDKETSLFVDMDNPKELYEKVAQALRDQRKRLRVKGKSQEKDEEKVYRPNKVSSFGMQITSSDSSIMGGDAAKRSEKGSSRGCCRL